MFPIRVKTVQESDLRMLGSLARNIQRVLPVTQADIDAAADALHAAEEEALWSKAQEYQTAPA